MGMHCAQKRCGFGVHCVRAAIKTSRATEHTGACTWSSGWHWPAYLPHVGPAAGCDAQVVNGLKALLNSNGGSVPTSISQFESYNTALAFVQALARTQDKNGDTSAVCALGCLFRDVIPFH